MQRVISGTIELFKKNWSTLLEETELKRLCGEYVSNWRERLLDPATTIRLMVLQILHGNTAMSHLRHLSGLEFTPSAYCQARMRLPLAVLEGLFERMCRKLKAEETEQNWWHGLRTFMVDGSSFSMPDTSNLRNHFGQPSGQRLGCGFPVANFLCLFQASTSLITKILPGPLYTHEMSQMPKLHPAMRVGDLLVGDRGFCSFAHISLLLLDEIHALFRMHQCQIVNFRTGRRCASAGTKGKPNSRWLKRLGIRDQIVEWLKPKIKPKWMTAEQYAALPNSVVVRELRYTTSVPGFRTKEVTLVTTLLDSDIYPAKDIWALYRKRWSVETNFANLKTTMGMNILRCETVAGVLKEMYVFCLVYNLVRLLMLEAANRQGVDIDRISFIDALRWLTTAKAKTPLLKLIVNPARPNRVEPRVIKRRPKNFRLMRKSRHQLKKELGFHRLAA